MQSYNLLVNDNVEFAHYKEVLQYVSSTLASQGIVKESHLDALLSREESFPTGIALDGYAVAIPHCEAEHALKPAIYILKLAKPVAFNRADEDSTIDISLVMALVVTSPADQVKLLKSLFLNLRDRSFYEEIMSSSENEIKELFAKKVFS